MDASKRSQLIFPALLIPRRGIWIHFVSHKLGRLLLPFALIAAAASSLWLPQPWRMLTAAAPTTNKQASAIRVMALVKRYSVPVPRNRIG